MGEKMVNPPPPDPESIRKGYEVADAKMRPLLLIAAGIALLTIAACLVVIWIFGVFEKQEALRRPAPAYVADTAWKAPGPRLQVLTSRDLAEYREAEEQLLTTYGWTDPHARTARIPVKRAMKIVLEKGFPVREETAS